jgi:hypothetical protein
MVETKRKDNESFVISKTWATKSFLLLGTLPESLATLLTKTPKDQCLLQRPSKTI